MSICKYVAPCLGRDTTRTFRVKLIGGHVAQKREAAHHLKTRSQGP